MNKKIAVLGQGYVGLPVSRAFTMAGLSVVGIDSSVSRCKMLNDFQSGIEDVTRQDLETMFAMGYTVRTNMLASDNFDYAIICVPTPLTKFEKPDLAYIEQATNSLLGKLAFGATVILESTTYPGTTEEIVLPILESGGLIHGRDFHLAFSPERIDPGNEKYGFSNTPKIVGGQSKEAGSRAADLYGLVCEKVVVVSSPREAEMAKLLENTYRHVNIALVNELAIVCRQLNINVREVIYAASTKPFGFQSFEPGPGVGGHCIPIDPKYLSFKVEEELGKSFEFVTLASKINSDMPNYVAHRVCEVLEKAMIPVSEAKVLIIGVAYKKDISDTRESPAYQFARQMKSAGASISFYDDFVNEWSVDETPVPKMQNLVEDLGQHHITVILQAHSGISWKEVERKSSIILDSRGVCDSSLPHVHGL